MKIATYNLRLGGKTSHRIHWNQVFETALPNDRQLIIGGDFNLSTGVRHPSELLQWYSRKGGHAR